MKNSVGVEQGGAGRERADLVVVHAYLLTMDAQRRVWADGAVAVRGREIVAVGPTDAVLARWEPVRTIDAGGAVVHPGFVDCHAHVTYHLCRGAFGDTPSFGDVDPGFFVPYLNALGDDEEYASSMLAILEMLGNGTTTFMEAGTAHSPAAVAAAAEDAGMRAVVGDPFLWDVTGADGYEAPPLDRAPASTKRALDLLGTELRRNADPDALVTGHVALQGMGTATDELELAAKAAADAGGTVLNQHQSYFADDTETDDRRHGRHPLVHLEELGVLGHNCVFSHVNLIRDDEVDPVMRSGMSIAWCPAASMMWGVGGTLHGRHADLYRRGLNIALGSDSSNWGVRFDLGTQGQLAVLTQRERSGSRTALVAEDALAMATINGAKAIGMGDRIGSLEVGKRADLVVRANDVPEAHPLTDPVTQLVYSARSKTVHTVVVDGRVVIEARQPTRVDRAAFLAGLQRTAGTVFDRMGYRWTPKWEPLDRPAA